MSLLQKVNEAPFISKISLDFTGILTATNEQETQNFFNSTGNELTWEDAYFGKRKVKFQETEKNVKGVSVFTQVLKINFPNSDKNRAARITFIKKAKFVKLELSNGLILVMGRNDFFQNKRPVIKASSDHKVTSVTFTTKSIFSTGYLEVYSDVSTYIDFLYPEETPFNLIPI